VSTKLQGTLRTGGRRHPKWNNFFQFDGSASKSPTKDLNGNWVWQTVSPEENQVLGIKG
jgi:hypothetical protein